MEVRPREDRFFWVAAACIAIAGLALAAPHLEHALWQDEAKTLALYASRGPAYPFTDYSLPNNHVLFSAVLAAWQSLGAHGVPGLRALPLGLFAASLVVFVFAVRRMAGGLAALFAVTLFATSHAVLSFALELRGYGASWLPVAGALLALPAWMERGRAGAGAIYAVSAAAAVAVLPTNLLAMAVLVTAALGDAALSGAWRRAEVRVRLVFAAAAPLLGGLAYTGVWGQVFAAEHWPKREWAYTDLFVHTVWGATTDFLWLLPLVVWGVVRAFAQLWGAPEAVTGTAVAARRSLALLAAGGVAPLLLVALLPDVPPPRTLVPLLPLGYAVAGIFMAEGWRALFGAGGRAALVVVLALAVGLAAVRERDGAGYVERNAGRRLPNNLYDQMYHHEYDPVATLEIVRSLADEAPSLFLTDYHGVWGLGAVVSEALAPAARPAITHYREFQPGQPPRLPPGLRLYFVSTNLLRVDRFTDTFGWRRVTDADRVASTGFFSIYRIERVAAEG